MTCHTEPADRADAEGLAAARRLADQLGPVFVRWMLGDAGILEWARANPAPTADELRAVLLSAYRRAPEAVRASVAAHTPPAPKLSGEALRSLLRAHGDAIAAAAERQ